MSVRPDRPPTRMVRRRNPRNQGRREGEAQALRAMGVILLCSHHIQTHLHPPRPLVQVLILPTRKAPLLLWVRTLREKARSHPTRLVFLIMQPSFHQHPHISPFLPLQDLCNTSNTITLDRLRTTTSSIPLATRNFDLLQLK